MRKAERPQYHDDQIRELIDQHIHSERDRAILKRNLCDDIKYEALAEEFGLSRTTIARIVPRCADIVFRHLL